MITNETECNGRFKTRKDIQRQGRPAQKHKKHKPHKQKEAPTDRPTDAPTVMVIEHSFVKKIMILFVQLQEINRTYPSKSLIFWFQIWDSILPLVNSLKLLHNAPRLKYETPDCNTWAKCSIVEFNTLELTFCINQVFETSTKWQTGKTNTNEDNIRNTRTNGHDNH